MKKKLGLVAAVGLILGGALGALTLNLSHQTYSLQQALNIAAAHSAPPYMTYSVQQALNILAQGHADSTLKYTAQVAANRMVENGIKQSVGTAREFETPLFRVNGAWTALNTTANYGVGTADSSRYNFPHYHLNRIRRDCTLDSLRIRLGLGTESNYDTVIVDVWRRKPTATQQQHRVWRSPNLLTGTGAGTRGLRIDPPVQAETGDYYAVYLKKPPGAIGGSILCAPGATNSTLRNTINGVPATPSNQSLYAMSTSGAFNVEVEFLSRTAPQVVLDGYSQMEGHDLIHWYSHDITVPTDTASATDPVYVTTSWDKVLFQSLRPGISWENAAVGGATAAGIMSRASRDVFALRPRVAICQMGGNDTDSSVVYSNVEAFLDSCDARDIYPIVIGLAPMTNKTNDEWFMFDRMNTALQTLCARHPTRPQFVLLQSALGLNRSTGTPTPPVGNLWDIIVAYNVGGLHYSADGQAAMAAKIDSALTFDPTP